MQHDLWTVPNIIGILSRNGVPGAFWVRGGLGKKFESVRTHGGADSVGLGVDEAPDLREVAVALRDELDGGGLHEEGVVGGEHPLDALVHALHQHRVPPAVHELPHLVVRGDLGLLQSKHT